MQCTGNFFFFFFYIEGGISGSLPGWLNIALAGPLPFLPSRGLSILTAPNRRDCGSGNPA